RGRDTPAGGLDPHYACAVARDADDLAVLDDVDAGGRSTARITPGDSVVADRAATPLQKPAEYRVAAVVEVDERHQLLDLLPAQRLVVDALQSHTVCATGKQVALRLAVEQVERAALADHRVEVELTLEPFPKLQRMIVETHIGGLEVIGAHDRRVAPDVA